MKLLTCILITLTVVGVYGDEPEKLVNGIPTSIQQYPHCVSIRNDNQHFCGGSIIDSRYILTAGHCVAPLLSDDSLRKSVTVVTGTTYLNTGGQAYKVEQIWSHEAYDLFARVRSPHDIGLIKLATPIQFGPNQRAIKLPTRDIAANDVVTIAAWGSTGYRKPIHENLQKLTAKTMFPEKCQSYYENFMLIDKTDFCTLIIYGTGLCNGDSGSGLIRNSDNTIVGLVSGGKPCARGYPDVYTNIYFYVPWIEQKMSL